MKRKTSLMKLSFILFLTSGIYFTNQVNAQTARTAMEVYEEGPVWQIMTFRAPPGRVEMSLSNTSKVWRHQLELAKEMGFMTDYKILTKWASSPDDWNIMVVEIFPNWASYDTFWEDSDCCSAHDQAERFPLHMAMDSNGKTRWRSSSCVSRAAQGPSSASGSSARYSLWRPHGIVVNRDSSSARANTSS